jgi:hypothetical protein
VKLFATDVTGWIELLIFPGKKKEVRSPLRLIFGVSLTGSDLDQT